MKFVMHRERTVASVLGLAIHFEKGVPTHVPPAMYREIIAIGGVPEEELADDELKSGNPNEPSDSDTRKIALFDAFDKMVQRNVREDFTAAGIPVASVLARELGWSVPVKERDLAWVEFRVGKPD